MRPGLGKDRIAAAIAVADGNRRVIYGMATSAKTKSTAMRASFLRG